MRFRIDSLRVAFSAVCAHDGVDVTGLPAPELLELSRDVARLRRDADVLMAQVAGEVRRRSERVEGVGLASRQGFRSAGELLAQATGGTIAEVTRLMGVGDLLADAEVRAKNGSACGGEGDSQGDGDGDGGAGGAGGGAGGGVDGEVDGRVDGASGTGVSALDRTPLTRFRADLADAVQEGQISIEAAAVFTAALAAVPDVERTYALFSKALGKAPGLALRRVRSLVWQAQAFADPEAWERREDGQHEARRLTVRDDTDGLVTVLARLTPLAAAPVRAVLDAGVRWAMQARRDDPDSDNRTAEQMRADILTDLCQHALDCTRATNGVKTTVIVRMTRAELESGVGVGEIDGTPQPVSVQALRGAAVDAHIIPAVLGGPSEVLDWGRGRRLFTQTQRLALVERDGGCAWCNAPPSWCSAHHIRWWDRDNGATDLSNGVLLCMSCHTRLHRDGWDIEVRNRVVHFIPPPSVDPARTPRIGGRKRHNLAA